MTFRWRDRYVGYCVAVVETPDAASILADFGADPRLAVRGDFRAAVRLHSEANAYHPVVQVVDRGRWSVVIEHSSFEGLRPGVLRRLAGNARTAGVAQCDDAVHRIFFADNGEVLGPFPAPIRASAEWPELELMARRAGVPLESWSDDDVPRSSFELVERICGFPITDEVMRAPGLIGIALPRLPDPSESRMPVRSELDAKLFAIVESATEDELGPAVSRRVRDMLDEAGVTDDELLAAVAGHGSGRTIDATDDSAVGKALRALIAEERLIIGGAVRPGATGRDRVSAGQVVNTLLQAGARAAVTEMAHRRHTATWKLALAGDLSSVEVTASAAAEADARRANAAHPRSGMS